MSYRRNSDVPRIYGWIDPAGKPMRERPPRPSDPPHKWVPYNNNQVLQSMNRSQAFSSLAKRPHRVAWLTSHCSTVSRRIEYVEELSKHVDVKVFGECGEQCGRGYSANTFDFNHYKSGYMYVLYVVTELTTAPS